MLCSALKLLAHFSWCYKFVSLMGHFIDVFLFKCFNRSRYSIDPKIQLSISFLRDENQAFNVFSEIKWWMVPCISSRKENSLPTELCSHLVSSEQGMVCSWKHQRSSESEVVPSFRFIDYTIVFRHQAQWPIERCLYIYAGQANSDPGLDLSLLGVWVKGIMDPSWMSSLPNLYLWANPNQRGSVFKA